MQLLSLLASTISLTSLALGLVLGAVLGGAFLLLRQRSVTVVQDETATVMRGPAASASMASPALEVNAPLSGEAASLSPAEVQELLHDFLPNAAAGLKSGESATVHMGEPHVGASASTRVLSGAEAQQFLHSTGLDRTVAAALGQAAGVPSSRPDRAPLPPAPLVPLRSKRRNVLALLLGLAVFAIPFGFMARTMFRTFAPAQMGTITSTGPALGDWTMNVDSCHTGMTRGFYGAQLYSSKDQRLGVWMVEDPLRGLVASVNSTTHGDAINLSRENCAVLSGSAANTGTTVNNVRVLQGEYTLDCQVEGSHVSGHVSFSHCL